MAHRSHAAHVDNALPIEVLFPLVFLAPVLLLAVWGFLKPRLAGGPRASQGPTTITDRGDGLAAFGGATLLATYGLAAGGSLAGSGLLAMRQGPLLGLLGLAVGGGVMAVTWYYYARRLKVMHVARAGELTVPHWPLRQGARIELAYGRKVARSCRLRHLHGELELLETHERRRNGERVVETRVLERHDLGDGGARQTDDGLHATFVADVPPPDGACPRTGLAAFWHALGLGSRREWRLRVHLDVEGLPDHDSQFVLRIVEPRPGEAPRPRRRRAA